MLNEGRNSWTGKILHFFVILKLFFPRLLLKQVKQLQWNQNSKLFFFFYMKCTALYKDLFPFQFLSSDSEVCLLWIMSRWADSLLQDFLVARRIHGFINYDKSSTFWSSKAAPDNHTIVVVFDCWCDVLTVKSCPRFKSDVGGSVTSEKYSSVHRIWT